MNYLQLPKEVWSSVGSLSGLQLAIYCDAWTWAESNKEGYRANASLADMFGVDERAIPRAVARLVHLGLVTTEKRKDGRRGIVPIVPDQPVTRPSRQVTKRSGDQLVNAEVTNLSMGDDQLVNPKGDQLVNQDKKDNREVKRKAKQEKEAPEIVFPWESDAFKEMWGIWIQERKDRRYKKLTPRGEQAALHDLQEMSGDDEQTAIKIIKQSIAKNWQGLFPLKNNGKPQLTPDQQANNREQLARYLATGKV